MFKDPIEKRKLELDTVTSNSLLIKLTIFKAISDNDVVDEFFRKCFGVNELKSS